MRWPAKLERRLGFLAIPNLTLGIIVVQVIAWVAMQVNPTLGGGMVLAPGAVRAGEWWRVFSFLMRPPFGNPILLFIALYLLWLMGSTLEREWGGFRYTLFWLVGWAASVALALILPSGFVTNAYLVASVYLAFAFLYPDFVVMIYFVIPMKVKWLAALTWLLYLFTLVQGAVERDWTGPAMVVAATLNFFLFFGRDLFDRMNRGRRSIQRKREALAASREPFHRCSVCGRTDLTDPRMDFRYAQADGGTRCFCEEHLPG